MTQIYGVVGDPVSHSLSPLIHNGWFRDFGIDARYAAFQVPEGEFPASLETFTRQGVRGLNVTLPHKLSALRASRSCSQTCERVGAANTLTRSPDGGWIADNTDVGGFSSALVQVSNELRGKSALVIGAGGAARGVCVALQDLGVGFVVANRTHQRAEDLVTSLGVSRAAAIALDDVPDHAEAANMVINCLSLGQGGALPLPPGNGRLFFELSYGKAVADTLSAATENGWQTADGLAMLVAQAADSFEIWRDLKPDRAAALARCRQALEAVT